MNTLAESIGHWLADYYLLSTILLGIALVAMRWIRQPARKLALTRAVIAGLLLLAVLCGLPDWSPVVHLAEPLPNNTAIVESVQVEPAASSGEAAAYADTVLPDVENEGSEAVVPVAETSPVAIAQPVNVAARVGWVFLVGVVVLAAWLGLGMWHLGRLCRESERAPARIVSLLERVAGAVPMLPRMLLNRRLPSAVALGVWDTSILIPKRIAEGDEKELGSVIAHEWAHVKNGDLRLLAASRLLLLLLWAHPLYWMLRVRMRLEQETLADAAAAAMTSRHDYAAQLVNWAKRMPAAPHRSLASAVGIWEGPSQLRRRIAMLLDEKLTVLRSCSRRWRWMAGSLCVLIAVALSLVTLRPGTAVADVGITEAEAEAASDVHERILDMGEVDPEAANTVGTEASASGGWAKNAVLEAISNESAELRGQEISVSARQAKYGEWLRRLMVELEKTKDPAVCKSLSIRALGYANSRGEYRTSEKLLLELIELEPARAARWAAELGGVYKNMSLKGLAKDHNLKRSCDAFALAIEKCDASEPSPQIQERLILTLANRGQVCDDLFKSTKDRRYLKEAAADYRRGGQELKRLSELADADAPAKVRKGGHGGYMQTYRTEFDGIVRLGYDADWFAQKELLACGRLKDDARANELLPKLMESPGSDVDRDYNVLLYATARYGITKYPKFVEFWNERPAIEKTAIGFFKAAQQLDHPAAAKLTVPGSPMAEMEREVFEKESAQINEGYGKEADRLLQVGETVVDGDWAAVRSLAPSDDPEHCLFVALKKLDGEWRIYDGDDYRFDKSLSKALSELKKGR